MRSDKRRPGFPVLILVLGMVIVPRGVRAGDAAPDWWQAQREITATLLDGTDLADLAATVMTAQPAGGQAAMFKLGVLLRAGLNQEAVAVLRDLREACPALDNHQVTSIFGAACASGMAWDVARATVEIFAENICELWLDEPFLEHLLATGWTIEQIDGWLAARPPGCRSYWFKERLRFNIRQGRGDDLIEELSARLRTNPQDIAGAVALLDALIHARADQPEPPDLAWMAGTLAPPKATWAHDLAWRLRELGQWRPATHFFMAAIKTPLTDVEVQRLARTYSALLTDEQIRAGFAVQVREGLAGCLLASGLADGAQRWMVEAADLRKQHDLGPHALLAGRVQAASGQRVIEERIKAREALSESDPEYWSERARYYRGRGETALEEQALTRGLALTTPQPEPPRPVRGQVGWRSRLLSDYARFLLQQDRSAEAVALLRGEIEQAPAMSVSARRAVHILAFDIEKQVRADDEVLWAWLANRPQWKHTAQRLLWRMLQNAGPDDLEPHLGRAEELARRAHPSRAFALGWIMNRMQLPQRSIPLLEYAAAKAGDEQLREHAAFTLFESCLDAPDWQLAEAAFPAACEHLTPREIPQWYARVALAAARAGAPQDALRLWRRVANLDLATTEGLQELAAAGLKDELAAFYGDMQRKMPSSSIPPRILEMLEEP